MPSKNSKTVGIVAKPSEAGVIKLAATIIAWLNKSNISYFVDAEIASEPELGLKDTKHTLARTEFTSRCDPILVLGGDGTFISAARHPAPKPTTIIGVNMGSLGFLTEIAQDEALAVLQQVLQEQSELTERSLLKTDVYRADEKIHSFYAMNDVVVTKEALARIFAVGVEIDDCRAANIRGDGIIVATPGGSTAYSLSAGGSIVHPSVDALLLTPICPHSLTSRPLVVPGKSQISLSIGKKNDVNDPVYLTVDGQEGMELLGGDRICITTSSSSYLVARSSSRSYYDVLGEKLNWAASSGPKPKGIY